MTDFSLPPATRSNARPIRRYTLHLHFAADDTSAARELAVALAEALGILVPEVDTYTARLSAGASRSVHGESVFCLTEGPDAARCGDVAGHDGWHAEQGINGMRWGQGDGGGTVG